jgi:hypothetical protein
MPQPARCPVELFRELLAKNPVERRLFLTNRSAVSQKLIMAKVREYEALGPEQRELRLRATELRWHLLPLMTCPVDQRAGQLAQIPEELRQLVTDRLKIWDLLPADAQKRLLEPTLEYVSKPPLDPAKRRAEVLTRISPARRAKLEAGIQDWQSKSETEREEIVSQFDEFFNLTPREKRQTLGTLSEPERRQIQRTLEQFGHLSPQQRATCLKSFEKFAILPLEERQQFLKNAERWSLMSPSERQAWKDLVYNLSRQPPLPPGLNSPPLPPRLPPRPSPSVATNQN